MMHVGRAQLETALAALGALLESRSLHFEVVVVGGGNLILQGMVSRPTTKDIDLLGELVADGVRPMRPMPAALREAIADVARTYGLAPDWINLGPDALLDLGLPEGFVARLERRAYGGLVTWFAGRFDMVCFKLYAAVDSGPRNRHLQDLIELAPQPGELAAAGRWTITQDPSPAFRSELVATIGRLGVGGADVDLD